MHERKQSGQVGVFGRIVGLVVVGSGDGRVASAGNRQIRSRAITAAGRGPVVYFGKRERAVETSRDGRGLGQLIHLILLLCFWWWPVVAQWSCDLACNGRQRSEEE